MRPRFDRRKEWSAMSYEGQLGCGAFDGLELGFPRGAIFPDDDSHAEEVVSRDLYILDSSCSIGQNLAHLFRDIRSPHRGDSVEARDMTPHQGKSREHQRQV